MSQRVAMMQDYEQGGYSTAALARRYGLSRRTAGKWIERFEAEQWTGLQDRSRARHTQAHAFGPEVEEQVVALKKQWPHWGAPKIRHKLLELIGEEACPGESTVGNVLRRNGLTHKMKARRMRAPPAPQSYGRQNNQTWCADFKGWWLTRDGQRCDPLTITDAASRYLIRCQGLRGRTGRERVQPIFLAAFREYGMPEAIRTDNGAPFASRGLCGLSKLSVWWLKHGIALERITPGHPEQNGRHERMHRTLKDAMGEAQSNLRTQQQAMDRFKQEYNHERPHEALNMAVPAALYVPSNRQWSEKAPAPMEYPREWETRKVRLAGQMKWQGRNVRISSALEGEYVGLEPKEDGLWAVYFGSYALGDFNERKQHMQPPRRQRAKSE